MNCSFAAFLERYKHFELIPGELYFTITEETVKSANSEVPVSILDYPKDFATDKTPPSIKQIHAFYAIVSRFIASGNTVHFYTSMANLPCSLVYICTFLMTRKKQSADLTFAPFSLLSALIKPFHDISGKELFYDLTVVSVLRSFEKAVVNKWFSMETFNSDQYEYFNQIHMNWIIPDVLLAFSTTTPVPQNKAFLAFNKLHINHFISLGGLVYEQSNFFNYGFDYTEMRLKGITPSIDELKEFLEVTSNDHTFVIHSNGQIDLSYEFLRYADILCK
ncbi:hypothetical protein TRFO_26435 [Tritrichomonas foetus]|uniref:Dual specificity/tyrosine protein phosphatase N-terminal domain-containing protein n=1 Tax=Tritrichomonas foetus TaxID=1144522 RepID=A0A1J4K4I5_9EUKA|nr:hypothetical protein TRFO_26435 [Tritrichomonas foetus]|eukprot:OHT05760.1 hypothetical protein TRFO_26435 [Tritrichomonas foetus]